MRPYRDAHAGGWIFHDLGLGEDGSPAPDTSVVQGPEIQPGGAGQPDESGFVFVAIGLALLFFVGGFRARPVYEGVRASQRERKIARLREQIEDLEDRF